MSAQNVTILKDYDAVAAKGDQYASKLQLKDTAEKTAEYEQGGMFVEKALAPSGHFGSLGMREWADLIGGRLEVQGEAGKGTRLSVRVKKS